MEPFGIPEGTQTPDTVLRRHVLYSTELLGHMLYGCFAVSKHYHRTVWVDFEVLRLYTNYPKTNWAGTPYKSRTCSLRIRSPSLYPIELMEHIWRLLTDSNRRPFD